MPTKLPQGLFTNTVYVDFQGGAGNGTLATPWNSFASLNTYILSLAGANMALQVVVAGTGTGLASSLIADRVADYGAGRVCRLGIRAWQQDLDGPRPSGQQIARPILDGSTVFTGTLTQVGATAVYKNTAINPQQNLVSQVTWRYGVAAQFDVPSGSYKSFLKLTTGALTDDNAIAATLAQYQAYYSTVNKQLYVNTTGLSTTVADYSWTAWQERVFTQFVETYSDGIDTQLGNRGHAIYDALPGSRVWNARGRDHDQHHVTFSQSNIGSVNHGIEDGQFFGLGKSGDPCMISIAGGVATFNSTGCFCKNSYFSRYVLLNPGGGEYQGGTNSSTPSTAFYTIWFANCGTGANAVAGTVLDWTFEQNLCIDVPSRVNAYQAFLFYGNHHKVPSVVQDDAGYSVLVKRCRFETEGYWNLQPNASGTANDRYSSYLFEDCFISINCNPDLAAGQVGFRVAVFPSVATQAGCGGSYRLKRSSLLINTWPKYTGGSNSFRVIGGSTTSVGGDVTKKIRISADDQSSITSINNVGNTYLFGFGNAVAAADQGMTITCEGTLLSTSQVPISTAVAATQLAFQDSTAGNARTFVGCRYNGFSQTAFSSQYATPALWKTNIDTTAEQVTDTGFALGTSRRVDTVVPTNIRRGFATR